MDGNGGRPGNGNRGHFVIVAGCIVWLGSFTLMRRKGEQRTVDMFFLWGLLMWQMILWRAMRVGSLVCWDWCVGVAPSGEL